MFKIATITDSSQPGAPGFSWYYCDILDESGNGLVLVWSLNLPFLPGSRTTTSAQLRPSLHMVTFQGGRANRYLLQELPPDALRPGTDDDQVVLGASSFRIERRSGRVRLEVDLDIEAPLKERLRGRVVVEGAALAPTATAELDQHHIWRPLSAFADGQVDLSTQTDTFQVRGGAYFDSNAASTPLHEQGITRWDWGRVRFATECLVYYTVRRPTGEPEHLGFLAGPDGRATPLGAALIEDAWSSSCYGVRSPRRLRFAAPRGTYVVDLKRRVDASPFYERYLTEGYGPDGTRGVGVSEVVLPERVDRPWMRPFVRMKTHALAGPNSFWLPLFSGVSGSPWSRLLRRAGSRQARGPSPDSGASPP